MLILNLKRIATFRGIEKAYSFLLQNDFVHSTATKLSSQKVLQIKISHIGKLCRLLHCTPNDLFEWQPEAANPLPDDHPLNQLIKEEIPVNVRNLLKDIPLDKMLEVENLLKSLKES